MRRGEIWWAEPPEVGRRPYLVLTREMGTPVLSTIIAVPATRTVRGIPTEVVLGQEDGMPDDCALTLDNITVVPKSVLVERITTLTPAQMERVCRALAVATGCR